MVAVLAPRLFGRGRLRVPAGRVCDEGKARTSTINKPIAALRGIIGIVMTG
jgi:hypothetical protein